MDLADAAIFLMNYDDQGQKHMSERTSSRLIQELVTACHVNDPFFRVLTQRTHMLQCAHEAWVRKYQNRERQKYQHQQHRQTDLSLRPSPSTSNLPSDVHLAMELLFSLLDFVQEDPTQQHDEMGMDDGSQHGGGAVAGASTRSHQRLELLNEIYPALQELPPLCLAPQGESCVCIFLITFPDLDKHG